MSAVRVNMARDGCRDGTRNCEAENSADETQSPQRHAIPSNNTMVYIRSK